MKIQGTLSAWIPDLAEVTPAELTQPDAVSKLRYFQQDMRKVGWTFVGVATIEVEIVDTDILVANAVDALREQAKSIRAEAAAKVTDIESKINNLLAIEHSMKDAK